MLNVWGSNDVLSEWAVGGYREELGGYTVDGTLMPDGSIADQLINVKILGADHFNYMRDSSVPNTAWNLTESEFVAKLLIAAKNKDDLLAYLTTRPFGVVSVDENNTFVINLPGHP